MFEKKLLELVSHNTWRVAQLNSSRGGANRPDWQYDRLFARESNFLFLNPKRCAIKLRLVYKQAFAGTSAAVFAFEIGPGFSPDIQGWQPSGLQPLGCALFCMGVVLVEKKACPRG